MTAETAFIGHVREIVGGADAKTEAIAELSEALAAYDRAMPQVVDGSESESLNSYRLMGYPRGAIRVSHKGCQLAATSEGDPRGALFSGATDGTVAVGAVLIWIGQHEVLHTDEREAETETSPGGKAN